jgi:hypothetical protein
MGEHSRDAVGFPEDGAVLDEQKRVRQGRVNPMEQGERPAFVGLDRDEADQVVALMAKNEQDGLRAEHAKSVVEPDRRGSGLAAFDGRYV